MIAVISKIVLIIINVIIESHVSYPVLDLIFLLLVRRMKNVRWWRGGERVLQDNSRVQTPHCSATTSAPAQPPGCKLQLASCSPRSLTLHAL